MFTESFDLQERDLLTRLTQQLADRQVPADQAEALVETALLDARDRSMKSPETRSTTTPAAKSGATIADPLLGGRPRRGANPYPAPVDDDDDDDDDDLEPVGMPDKSGPRPRRPARTVSKPGNQGGATPTPRAAPGVMHLGPAVAHKPITATPPSVAVPSSPVPSSMVASPTSQAAPAPAPIGPTGPVVPASPSPIAPPITVVSDVPPRISPVAPLPLSPTQGLGGTDRSAFLTDIIDSASFASMDVRRNWLVKGAMVQHEPMILGGPKKSLKTSIVLDLAVSLGSGTRFLSHFEVPRCARTLVLSGESGLATMQETTRRICAARRVAFSDLDVLWGQRLPHLDNPQHMAKLTTYLHEQHIEVLVLDPAYLALLGSGVPISTANVFQVGPLLFNVGRACSDAGTTLILVHHARKMGNGVNRGFGNEPLDLDDLSQAGFAEFARQWMLLSRREAYDPGDALHRLWFNCGGSAGHGVLVGLEIAQGQLDDQFGGRTWQVCVRKTEEIKQERNERKAAQKEARTRQADEAAVAKVRQALGSSGRGDTVRGLAERTRLSKAQVQKAIDVLSTEGRAEETEIIKPNGRGQRAYPGWKLHW